ncbi:MAG TPA: hypothetical protein VK524_11380, partial [Polyangiaceae bacterium]|nr:hypothetical protein [Polyangiaceae bacterium]
MTLFGVSFLLMACSSGGVGGVGGAGGSGAAGGTGGTTSVPIYSFRVDSPQNGATVRGVVTVSGVAPGYLNVEVLSEQATVLARTTPSGNGAFSMSV